MKLRYRIGRWLLLPRAQEIASYYEHAAVNVRDPVRAEQLTYLRMGVGLAMHNGDDWKDLVIAREEPPRARKKRPGPRGPY